MTIVGIALIGRKNSPIFIDRYDGGSSLALQFLIHGCLDVFDERIVDKQVSRNPYIGFLTNMEGFSFYGLMSNSLVKAVVVWNANHSPHFDMGHLTKRVYRTYVNFISNPFVDIKEAENDPDNENEWLSQNENFRNKIKSLIHVNSPNSTNEQQSIRYITGEQQNASASPPPPPPSHSPPPAPPASQGTISTGPIAI